MNNDFLDEKNFKFLINFVFNNIKQKGYDVNNDKYMFILKKLIQTIYNKNANKKVSKEYLNNLVIDKCIPFIIKQIEKDKSKLKNNRIQNIPNLYTSPRPDSSTQNDFSNLTLNNNDFSNLKLNTSNNPLESISTKKAKMFDSKSFDDFSKERNYQENDKSMEKLKLQESFDKSVNLNSSDDNTDIMAKMRSYQNERNYNNQNNNNNSFSIKTQNIEEENLKHSIIKTMIIRRLIF